MTYLTREWSRRGELMKIERLMIDSGYKPGICSNVKRRVGGATTMLSKGVGIKAGRKLRSPAAFSSTTWTKVFEEFMSASMCGNHSPC
jgi:hypothetical protein